MGYQNAHVDSRNMLTWRRMPIPVKTAAAGGNICGRARQRVSLELHNVSEFTGPATLRNPENADMTFTVGSSHFVHLSSALCD